MENKTFLPANILLPNQSIDLYKWTVIACDQYTSNKEYWEHVNRIVDDSPSTLHLIYPEVYLETTNADEYITSINRTMSKYLESDFFDIYEKSMIWLERKLSTGLTRHGLILNLDLEDYHYMADTAPLIRSTEETIVNRIPPRVKIRENASIELPHIVLLYHDPAQSLFDLYKKHKHELPLLYNFDLMQNGGTMEGHLIADSSIQTAFLNQLHHLSVSDSSGNQLLGVMGDGNHSLASAKAHWEAIKASLPASEIDTHPARYALVELVNLYDVSMEFEPIHRVLFHAPIDDFIEKIQSHYHEVTVEETTSDIIPSFIKESQSAECVSAIISHHSKLYKLSIHHSNYSTATAAFQSFIDYYLTTSPNASIDYIHGESETLALSNHKDNIGIILPAIIKEQFFDSILKDGPFPRKTFSIGHADDKRFYLEARKIK